MCALVATPIVLTGTDPTLVLLVRVCAVYAAVLGAVGVMYTREVALLLLRQNVVAPSGGGGTMATATAAGATSTSMDVGNETDDELVGLQHQKTMLLDKIEALENPAEKSAGES